MKRLIALILSAFLLFGCFAGCHKESPIASTEPTQPSVPSEPTLPPLTVDPRFESLAQEAVVKTALAFLNRGNRIQYEDSLFSTNTDPKVYRWQVGIKSPEDYTSQFLGYTNCAAFTYDVYLQALDYDIGAYTTRKLTAKGESQRVYTYIPTGKETDADKAAVEADFRKNLKIGDIIVVRYNGSRDGNGHAMLYVGTEVLSNGQDIIHSTGGSYSMKNYRDSYESSGTVRTMSTNSLFSSGSSLYTFSKVKSLVLIRPLNTFKGSVPEKSQNRIRNLEGIIAEKLSSHTYAMTVNPGDTMTFQFMVTNKNDKAVTLDIQDTVPTNCAYVSGAETVSGGVLEWKLTVPANDTASVSYTVKVNDNAAIGDTVYSDGGMVGGVDTDCPEVYIAKTLSAQEQEKIKSAAAEVTGKEGMALLDAIYEKALDRTSGLPATFAELDSSLYTLYWEPHYRLKDERGMLDLIPAGMFGGRYVTHRMLAKDYMRLEYIRTRMPYARDLMIGDIIMAVGGPDSQDGTAENLFLFTGSKLLDLYTGKTTDTQNLLNMLSGYRRFAIIRPSMGM